MRCESSIYFAVISVLVWSIFSNRLAAQSGGEKQLPRYYVFNLGSPGGGSAAAAASINDAGWISGSALPPGNITEHAELWVGTAVDMGTLGGPNSAVAWPNKNNRGMIAGISETGDVDPLGENWSCGLGFFPTITHQICVGFLWQNGAMSPLHPLPGGLNSFAAAVNNKGQVAGWAENNVHESTCTFPQVLQFEAVIWGPQPGQMTQLPPLSGDLDGAATAINDKGEIVGISGICDQAVGRFSAKHVVLWENGVPINLGNFDGGVAWNTPTAMNNKTEIVGFANQPDTPLGNFNPVAFLWTKEHGMQQLPPIGSDTNNLAWGINDRGQVVGQSGQRAFLYEDGQTMDLNSLIQPNSSLYLELANDINDRGEIVGFAQDLDRNQTVAFLAVPVSGSSVTTSRSNSGWPGAASLENVQKPVLGFNRFASDGAQR